MTWKRAKHLSDVIWAVAELTFLVSAFVCGQRAFHGNIVNLQQVFFSVQALLFAIWCNQLHTAWRRHADSEALKNWQVSIQPPPPGS